MKGLSEELKELATCPITHEIFLEPVRVDCPSSHCFEKEAIQSWCNNNATCPTCRSSISHTFKKDIYIANLVSSLLKENRSYEEDQYFSPPNMATLFNYYKKNDTKTVLQVLKKNPSYINKPINDGQSLLHHAILDENKEFTQALLALDGIDVNQPIEKHPNRKHSTRTPLHLAACAADPIFIQMLLAKGADPSLTTELGYSPLMDAVWGNKKENVKLLLAHSRTDINQKDDENNTVLHDAINRSDDETFQLLLDNKNLTILNHKNYQNQTPLFKAVSLNQTEKVRLLLTMPGIDIRMTYTFENKTYTLLEISYNNFSIQTLLIDKMIENEYQFNPYEVEIIGNMLQELNQKNKNEFNEFLLRLSLLDFYQPLCIQLVKKLTPLIYQNKDYKLIVEFIKKYFVLVDDLIVDGKTFLQLMVTLKQNEIVQELLLITHININYQNTHGNTALHDAVIYNNQGAIVLLLQKKDINAHLKNKKQETPFDIALKKGNLAMVQLLFPFFASNLNFKQILKQPMPILIQDFFSCYQTILNLANNIIPSAEQITQLMQLTKESCKSILKTLKTQSHPNYEQIKYLLNQINTYQQTRCVDLKINENFFKNIEGKDIIEQLNQLFLISHAFCDKDNHWQTQVRTNAYGFFKQSLQNLDQQEKYKRLIWAKKQTIFTLPESSSFIDKLSKTKCEQDIDHEIQNVRKLNK